MPMQADITVTNLNAYSSEELPDVIAEQLEAVARRLRTGMDSAQINAELGEGAAGDEVQTFVALPFVNVQEKA